MNQATPPTTELAPDEKDPAVLWAEISRLRSALTERSSLLPSGAMPAEIQTLIERLHTQDNRITDNPLFAVQQRVTVGGMGNGYEDGWVWANSNSEEVQDDDLAAELNARFTAGEAEPDGYRRVGFKECWEFVTGSLTEAGAQAYIDCNGHNLRQPRIYAYGSYRNAEFIALRRWLMSLRAAAAVTTAPGMAMRSPVADVWQPIAPEDLAQAEAWAMSAPSYPTPADTHTLRNWLVHMIREVRAARTAATASNAQGARA